MENHLGWLKSNGMVCNVVKTELMIMNIEDQIVDGRTIKSKKR
jgi:hypothetical protein